MCLYFFELKFIMFYFIPEASAISLFSFMSQRQFKDESQKEWQKNLMKFKQANWSGDEKVIFFIKDEFSDEKVSKTILLCVKSSVFVRKI